MLKRLLFPFLVAAIQCFALDPNQPSNSYMQNTFTVEDGLPSNTVNAIVQTRDGFLWVGTDAGMARFNGRRFSPVSLRDPGATPLGVVRAIAEAENGDLWVGTDSGLVHIPSKALDHIEDLRASIFHPGSGKSNEVTCLKYVSAGVVWIGTHSGLYRHQGDHSELIMPKVSVSRLEQASNGNLLIISDQGFIEFDPRSERVIDHPGLNARLGLLPNQVFHVIEDHDHVEWLCTRAGLAKMVGGVLKRIPPYGGAVDAAFRAVEDAQGNIWVFTQTGIFRAGQNKLEPFAPGMNAASAYSDRDGQIWIGRKGDGLVRFRDRAIRMLKPFGGLMTSKPMAVLSTSDGKLWAGNSCGGLSLFDGHGFKTYDEKDGLSNSCVWALAEDTKHGLWLGTAGGGLFRFKDGRFTQYGLEQGMPSQYVRAICALPDGSLLIATPDGLSHMIKGAFHNYTKADGLSSDHVINAYQDRQGTVWAATANGLDRMIGDRFVAVTSTLVPMDSQSIGFSEDSLGNLYAVSTPGGVGRINGTQLLNVDAGIKAMGMLEFAKREFWFSSNTGIFRVPADGLRGTEHDHQIPITHLRLDREDGLAAAQCSSGVPNMTIGPDGHLWVATVQGLAVIDIAHMSHQKIAPVIFADEVTVGRNKQPAGHELVLPPGIHHVEIGFDAIELASPEKIRFQYRLDGVDSDWLNSDNSRTATYTNIPTGLHLFHFRACNKDGFWDQTEAVYAITQRPYYFETTTFRLGCCAFAVGALAALYFLRLRQITAQISSRLEERLDERERIARDLHDTLLQSYIAAGLQVHAAVGSLEETPTAREHLERAIQLMNNANEESRSALGTLRYAYHDKSTLEDSFAAIPNELGIPKGTKCKVSVEGQQRALQPVIADNVYRIGREAIVNALLHAGANSIEIEIEYTRDKLCVRVHDDGSGIDSTILESGRQGHWGLNGMKERSKSIGATLHLFSKPGRGTAIDLTVPARFAFLRRYSGTDPNR